MQLTLPQRTNGSAPLEMNLDGVSSLIIIGANGAGKTRFTTAVVESLGKKALRLSALDGLYNRRPGADADTAASLRGLMSQAVTATAEKSGTVPTTLELLLSQLMHDEMINLIGYKLARAEGANAPLKSTKLDRVIELWQDVFPQNRVLIDSGRILFARGMNADIYPALRLSDGERAVLYYAAAVLYAPKGGVIFVDSPEMFLHPTITSSLWNRLEASRRDCTFCYTTHDTEFAASRNGAPVIWVREYSPENKSWEYDIMPPTSGIAPELYMTLAGARKPILFIEGDSTRSIDAKLYPLIFPDYTVRSLGSCNKVIESTRTFNDLTSFHKVDSVGIVDRDRRNDQEVAYLRRKRIMVPDVAEIENMLLLEDIVRAMAGATGNNPVRVFDKVRKTVLSLFRAELRQQALLHTRHYVKRMLEYRADSRSASISNYREHLSHLMEEINPQPVYDRFCSLFHRYEQEGDYNAILRVFNQKAMLGGSNVAQLCGFKNHERYIDGIIAVLSGPPYDYQRAIIAAVRRCLGADEVLGGGKTEKPE